MRKFLKLLLIAMLLIGLIFGGKSIYDKQMSQRDYDEAAQLAAAPKADASAAPTAESIATPTAEPTATPTAVPTATPTAEQTVTPTVEPTATPTAVSKATSTAEPTVTPTAEPTVTPTAVPTATPTAEPTATPTAVPTSIPTSTPTSVPTKTKETLTHSDPLVMELLMTNLDALREVNPDIIGWVTIPDTQISYPIVQGEDNDFYLKHTWKKQPNEGGAIFMEAENSADMSDFNTIIYGHNMNNSSMFSDLTKYESASFMARHPSAYVVTDNGVYRYDFFSTYKANVKSITYGMKIQTAKKRNELIDFNMNYSVVKSDIVPDTDDHLLTLSTCSGFGTTARWVVVGVLNEEGSCLLNNLP